MGERLDLLERVAPRLLWLRRGPLYDADDRAGSATLSPSRIPGASFTHTTTPKLAHDLEQFEYLASRGWKTTWLRTVVVPAYEEVLRRAEIALEARSQPGITAGLYALSPLDVALVGSTYNRALFYEPGDHWLPGERLAEALSQRVPWDRVDGEFQRGQGRGVVYVDDVLANDALDAILDYCRSATLFFETKTHGAGGHLGAYVVDGFSAPLLFQVAEDLKAALPRTLGSLPLRNMWAYKYSYSHSGIMVHKDQAAVNVNLWVSPDAANLEPDRGGLKIFDDDGALEMERAITPPELQGDSGRAILGRLPNVTIPFKQNRITVFDSALPHLSDVGRWAEGYENRRISITFLFGDPS
ncbi:hypothetical protein CTAYLR_009700 [Chrysophaeum taylorii]|uniref:Uncharacterized protein n=1 Tax=Chrysophaeum taylorii TaxID=2483200 RepID=A0AAD7U8N9_9STRA|nr:hypothetical protein CTAYLR_009700 [Chrysophaeum taylorii]